MTKDSIYIYLFEATPSIYSRTKRVLHSINEERFNLTTSEIKSGLHTIGLISPSDSAKNKTAKEYFSNPKLLQEIFWRGYQNGGGFRILKEKTQLRAYESKIEYPIYLKELFEIAKQEENIVLMGNNSYSNKFTALFDIVLFPNQNIEESKKSLDSLLLQK